MTTRAPLSEAERLARLRLARADGVGPATYFGLLARFATTQAALDALPTLAARAGRRIALPPPGAAEAELAGAAAIGARVVAAGEADYPALLAALTPPPPIVTLWGDPCVLARPTIAIVGARNASAAGLKIATTLARDLAAAGWTIVSGLARGIDGAAHRASLPGATVAVVAGGVATIYPPEHEALHHAIAHDGLVVSERALGAVPQARDFPRRNRLISGLSRGVVVVEAEARSGSLITARFALEQGREVLAVPGSPLEPRARGPNSLLREGAILVESADDVISAFTEQAGAPAPLAIDIVDNSAGESAADDPNRVITLVRAALSATPMSIDDLARAVDLPVRAVLASLVELEIAGEALTLPGGAMRVT